MRSFFWGIFLVSSGLFFILKYFFNWNISTGRLLIGLFLISLGLSALIGGFGVRDGNHILFREGRLTSRSADGDCNIIFGQGILDLSDTPTDQPKKKIEVNTVFASTEVILPRNASVSIEANSAFASTEFPDGSQLTFGERTYRSDPAEKGETDLMIEMNTVFGRTVIRRYEGIVADNAGSR